MIAQLTGKVVSLNLTEVVLDVNGVGYFVSIPMSTYDVLPKEGGTATLLTYLQVREDALQLFGFATKNEIEIFKLLITVNGIGAKTALAILSSMNISVFCNAIVNADMKALYPKAITTCVDPATKAPLTINDPAGKPQQMGHWVNKDHYNYDVMGTCLAALQLMVYYRYLPTTQLKATEVEADVESLSKDATGEVGVSIDI